MSPLDLFHVKSDINERVSPCGGNIASIKTEKLSSRARSDLLIHILPSYHLDQTLYGGQAAAENHSINNDPPLPIYTAETDEGTFRPDNSDGYPFRTSGPAKSILSAMSSMPYSKVEVVKLNVVLNTPAKQIYTNGDILDGTLIIENLSPNEIFFDALIVSLEGRETFSDKQKVPTLTRKTFLNIVDVCGSHTGSGLLCDSNSLIPSNKRLPPYSIFQKDFSFKIPVSLVSGNDSNSQSVWLGRSCSQLPPSHGSLPYFYPLNPHEGPTSGSVSLGKNDLTDLSNSITYSINARLTTVDSNVLSIGAHKEILFPFVPTSILHTCGELSPTQQLKSVLRLVERELQAASKLSIKSAKSDSFKCCDSEKQKILVENESLENNISEASKISFDEPENFTRVLEWKLKLGKSLFGGSSQSEQKNKSYFSISSSGVHEPLLLSFTGNSNELSLDFKLKYQIPLLAPAKRLIMAYDPEKLFPVNRSSLEVDLSIMKFKADGFCIDLDPKWFMNTEAIQQNLVNKIRSASKIKRNLPANTPIHAYVVDTIDKLSSMRVPNRHYFSTAFHHRIEDQQWQAEQKGENMMFSKDVSVFIKIDPAFASRFFLIPSFQTTKLARLYSLRLKLRFQSQVMKIFQGLDDFENSEIILDIPLEIRYQA